MAYLDENKPTEIHLTDGKTFDFNDPGKTRVNIHDVAHSLARLTRYTGHVQCDDYSVAKHSILALSLARDVYHEEDPTVQLAVLMHDAQEMFTNDISTPLKRFLLMNGFDMKAYERRLRNEVIVPSFGFEPEVFDAGVIHDADDLCYCAEIEVIKPMGHGALPEDLDTILKEAAMHRVEQLLPLTRKYTEHLFMSAFATLASAPDVEVGLGDGIETIMLKADGTPAGEPDESLPDLGSVDWDAELRGLNDQQNQEEGPDQA